MGLFKSLFGSAGSNKADKMRQAALDAWGAIKTPELSSLQVQLQKEVDQGNLTPEQAEAQLLSSNAFNDIQDDPSLKSAQSQALQGLQNTANAGGLTAVDKARLADITDEQNQEAKGRLDAIQSNAQERGVGGSGLTLASELQNEQSAADRAARSGTDVAAQAQQAALQALIASGQLGGSIRAQDYGEAANKAQAQNAIDVFNKQALNATNLYNTQTANEAQAANLAERQRVADTNTNTANNQALWNANANQTLFNDQAAKAAGEAGVYNNWANDATAAKNKEQAGDMALFGGAVNAGVKGAATAFGGAPAAAATPNVVSDGSTGTEATAQKSTPNGEYYFENQGGIIPDKEECYSEGGPIRINPAHKGMLHEDLGVPQGSPIPEKKLRSALHSDDEAVRKRAQFAENAKHFQHKAEGGPVHDFRKGGPVPGIPKVPGNSLKNDTVKAKVSPGELVVPRTAMSDEEEFNRFMEQFRPQKKEKISSPDQDAISSLRRRLQGGI